MTRKLNGSMGTFGHVIKGFHVNFPKSKSKSISINHTPKSRTSPIKTNHLPWSANNLYPKTESGKYTYTPGMKVTHLSYGDGIITDVYDGVVRVKFDNRDRGAKNFKSSTNELMPKSVAIHKANLRKQNK